MARDTIIDRLFQRAKASPDAPALYRRDNGTWQPTTWSTYAVRVRAFAKGLLKLGHPEKGPLAILGFNSEEWVVADLGVMAIGGAPAGVYTTCSPEEVRYLLEHSESFAVVVENATRWRKQVEPIQREVKTLKKVILIEPDPSVDDDMVTTFAEVEALGREQPDDAFDARFAAIEEGQLGTLIYTSGTTGPPKAVMLSHKTLAWTGGAMAKTLQLRGDDVLLSYLPLSHIAEQLATIHVPITCGYRVHFAESMDRLKDNLAEVRPTAFLAVPRVWEKMHAALSEKMSKASGVKALLLGWARGVGTKVTAKRMAGRPLGFFESKQYGLANRLIFSKVKGALGFDRVRVAITAAAPISKEILDFFATIDIPILEVYGQSEGCGPTTSNRPGQARFGTVGHPLEGVDVKIADDGEILVKGNNVFMGYYKNQEATEETLKDGWLFSGDVGEFDPDGFLRITDRKKDLIITAGGKNIAPQNIEGMLKLHPLVGHAVCIGDRRKFVSALLTLNPEACEGFASEVGIQDKSLEALAKDERILKSLQQGVDEVNRKLAKVEQVKKFTVLPLEFTPESGELTPTMKVKRKIVNERYGEQIESMYA